MRIIILTFPQAQLRHLFNVNAPPSFSPFRKKHYSQKVYIIWIQSETIIWFHFSFFLCTLIRSSVYVRQWTMLCWGNSAKRLESFNAILKSEKHYETMEVTINLPQWETLLVRYFNSEVCSWDQPMMALSVDITIIGQMTNNNESLYQTELKFRLNNQ